MRIRKLLLVAFALFVVGTFLGWVFRGEIVRWLHAAVKPMVLMTSTPGESIRISLKIAFGMGVLWCSPVVGVMIARPRRGWMVGALFAGLAVVVLVAVAWMAARHFREMAEASPFEFASAVPFDAVPVWRILLSGPVVVWVMAMLLRAFGRREKAL